MYTAICASCPSRCQTTLGESINSRPRGRVCHDIREEAKMSWRHFMSDAGEKEVQVEMLMRWRVRELWVSEKPRPFEPQGKPAVALQRNRMEAEASERVVEFVYGNDVGRKR